MIRPHRFYPNPETAADNAFQKTIPATELDAVSDAARHEFDEAVAKLRSAGVDVKVVDDTATPEKPDAVFPNNWLSTHHDGRVVLYPMYSAVRRRERRLDVIDELRKHYRVTEVIDYSESETAGSCLEGTGSLVLDHANRIAYVSLSQRTHPDALRKFCDDFDYEAVTFRSVSENGQPIYHTNVMMCVGTHFALVGLESIPNASERHTLRETLERTGKSIVELDETQIANFAGNAIELRNATESLLVLSERAVASLTGDQRLVIEQHARLLPLALPTIELAGGSARCMLATIHLPVR